MSRARPARKSRKARWDGGVLAGLEQFDRIEAAGGAELGAHVVVHGREAGGIREAFERFEIQLGEVDAIPIEAPDQVLDAGGGGAEAIAIGEVHELAPIELGVLQDGGFFAPLGMIVPELLADVRQFEPGVDQDAVGVAGVDEALEVGVAFGIGLVEVPGGDVQRGDAGVAPARGEVVEIDAQAVGGIEEGPQAGGAEGRVEAQVGEGLQQVGEALVAALAGRDGEPEDGARAAAEAGQQGGAGPAFFGEDFGFGGDFEAGQFEALFPDDGQLGQVHVFEAADAARFPWWRESRRTRRWRIRLPG